MSEVKAQHGARVVTLALVLLSLYAQWLDAPLITVATRGAVIVRTVAADRGRLVPVLGFSRDDWCAPATGATFLIVDRLNPQDKDVSAASGEATFGRADQQIVVGPYTILVWNHGMGFP